MNTYQDVVVSFKKFRLRLMLHTLGCVAVIALVMVLLPAQLTQSTFNLTALAIAAITLLMGLALSCSWLQGLMPPKRVSRYSQLRKDAYRFECQQHLIYRIKPCERKILIYLMNALPFIWLGTLVLAGIFDMLYHNELCCGLIFTTVVMVALLAVTCSWMYEKLPAYKKHLSGSNPYVFNANAPYNYTHQRRMF